MTIKIPRPNVFDKLLNLLGKKRGVKVPTEAYEKYGPHVYVKAEKESVWKALMRPKKDALPDDLVDLFSLKFKDNNSVNRN